MSHLSEIDTEITRSSPLFITNGIPLDEDALNMLRQISHRSLHEYIANITPPIDQFIVDLQHRDPPYIPERIYMREVMLKYITTPCMHFTLLYLYKYITEEEYRESIKYCLSCMEKLNPYIMRPRNNSEAIYIDTTSITLANLYHSIVRPSFIYAHNYGLVFNRIKNNLKQIIDGILHAKKRLPFLTYSDRRGVIQRARAQNTPSSRSINNFFNNDRHKLRLRKIGQFIGGRKSRRKSRRKYRSRRR